jgi:hypothetical protein
LAPPDVRAAFPEPTQNPKYAPRANFNGLAVQLRTVLSIVNLVAVVAAFLVLFEFPEYSSYAFLGLLVWIGVGFVLMYVGARRGPVPSGTDATSPFGGPPSPPAPLPRGPPTASPIDFCIYCGTTLPAGSTVCAACGHRIAPF